MGGMYSLEENFVSVDFEMLLLLFSADEMVKFHKKMSSRTPIATEIVSGLKASNYRYCFPLGG